MRRQVRNRLLAGVLAALMVVSNVDTAVYAAMSDTEITQPEITQDDSQSSDLESTSFHLSMENLWVLGEDGSKLIASAEDTDGQTVYNFSVEADYAPSYKAGFDIVFTCEATDSERGMCSGDYIEFSLPSALKDVSVEAEDSWYSCDVQAQDGGESKVTVTLQELSENESTLTGRLHISFSLEEALEAGNGTCSFDVLGTEYKLVFGEESESEPEPAADIDKLSITCSGIEFSEKLDGTDWQALVRPNEFDEKIKIVQTYEVNGVTYTNTYEAQDSVPKEDFYLKFYHDGNGSGHFTIVNVPKSVEVTDENGTTVLASVTGYKVTCECSQPYYETKTPMEFNESAIQGNTLISTLVIGLKTQTLTMQPTVIPEAVGGQFTMAVKFTNPQLNGNEYSGREISKEYKVNAGSPTSIQVPVGISYNLSQKTTEGYYFDNKYVVTAGTETTTMKDSAQGTISEGTDVTITTSNTSQNVSLTFYTKWNDNENINRPALTESNFRLLFKVGDGEYKELTEADYASLNIESGKAPTFDSSQSAQRTYSYKGLPAADANGNAVSWQVEVRQNPESYVSSYTDNEDERTFTFSEQTQFTASMKWNDADEQGSRPTTDQVKDKLHVYRRVGTGTYEVVTDAKLQITESGSEWKLSIENLPRYSSENGEYDYVLVQGTMEADGTVSPEQVNASYKANYDNATGSFGSDISRCHNGGTITQVLTGAVNFEAKKEWKDPTGSASVRPASTVTLWRYVEKEATDLDDAYTNGKASQVICQTTDAQGKAIENVLSYKLSGEDTESIIFDTSKVSGLPADFTLPVYDDHGYEYVYFVRESLSGENAEEYEVQYSDGEKTYKNGAPINGTITNVRRKKEAVSVTKLWQNPSGLDGISGVKVKAVIKASADGGITYDELTVYSDTADSYEVLEDEEKANAQTISGFTSVNVQGEKVYYINTFNSEGKPYDMSSAIIEESIDGWTTETTEGKTTITDPDGNTYNVETSVKGAVTLADGMTEYRYTQTNTITAKREYDLIKIWGSNICKSKTEMERVEQIASIQFKLERRSTKNKADGSPADYEEVKNPEGGSVWTVDAVEDNTSWKETAKELDKYDEEGYEYYYKATEVGFVLKDGTLVSISDANKNYSWSQVYNRTPDQTKVTNDINDEGRGFVTISKIWQDNGDSTDNHKDVTVRIYLRSQVKEILQNSSSNYGTEDIVNLDNLGLKYYEVKLNSSGAFTAYVSYKDVDKSILGKEEAENSKLAMNDYLVLEYCVGSQDEDGAQAAEYTYGQLLSAAGSTNQYSLSGTAENSSRCYTVTTTVDPSDASVLFTNIRCGTTELVVNKTWKDDKNVNGLRNDSIEFQLCRDGDVYKNIPDTVTITALDDSCNVSLNHDTGIIKVSTAAKANTAENWSFKVSGLEMFSTVAVPYSYNLDEVAEQSENESQSSISDEGDDNQSTVSGTSTKKYSYSQKKLDITSTENGKTQTITFGFENTISGTTSHTAYKFWNDAAIDITNRPDLYISVYRYLKDDYNENPNTPVEQLSSYEPYNQYKDLLQTPYSESSAGEYETDYNWKFTVENLPMYDADGKAWVYVFTERMNNDGKTVMGTYTSETQTKTVNVAILGSNDTLQDTYEVFTNTIVGSMMVEGKKTWSGISSYHTDSLPDPIITLYRTTDDSITNLQEMTDEQITELVENGRLTLVDTTHLSGSGKTSYSFPDTTDKTQEALDQKVKDGLFVQAESTYMLPKFDADGKRYSYLVRETFADNDSISSQLYNEINTNGTLSNKFRNDINRRTITVTKKWTGRENLRNEEAKYPSVTYTLYRYEAGKDDNTAVQIASYQISAAEIAEAVNGEVSHTFTDLLVYSPSGAQYFYYIEEKDIDGYAVTYTDEEGIVDGSLAGNKIITGPGKTLTITEELLSELQKNDRIDIISLPDGWDTEKAPDTPVGTTNSYTESGLVNIAGDKLWNDYLNFEGSRPDTISLTLRRYTANEKGQNNKVDETVVELEVKDKADPSVKTPYIVWDYGEDKSKAAKWTYTIYNLSRYAANGMPYSYSLSEGKVEGYAQAKTVSVQPNSQDTVTMPELKNEYSGSYYVRKDWMDGSNKYNLRPTSVTVKLQRTTQENPSEDNWQDIVVTDDQIKSGLPSDTTNDDGVRIVSKTLTSANVIKNTKNNSWEYTFTNLPTTDKDGNTYHYRCVETAIGGIKVEDGKCGAYSLEYTVQNDKQTNVVNTLSDTTLYVEKVWVGDSNDLYQSRPDSLTFKLQKRRQQKDQTLGEWEDVCNADGSAYTFTITKEDEWKKKLEDLPIAEIEIGTGGKSYVSYSLYFRAVEVHADDTADQIGTKPKGAQNYIDNTDYSANSQAHVYNSDAGSNISTITNTLRTDNPSESVKVNKSWIKDAGSPAATAVFELLYKTTTEETWHSYAGQEVLQSLQSDASTQSISWKNLPKYNRDGEELQYKVEEHSLSGYKIMDSVEEKDANNVTKYTFINLETQSYTVKKIWQNASEAEKDSKGSFTAVFKLQKQIDGENTWSDVTAVDEWSDVNTQGKTGYSTVTLSSKDANATETGAWQNLPKYTKEGKKITYRAVETSINGKTVNAETATNGAYMVSYCYGDTGSNTTASHDAPVFGDTQTTVTNRMIYGFVNLSKKAAYLSPSVQARTKEDGQQETEVSLEGVTFDIYQGTGDSKKLYVSNVTTDANGNLENTNGKYGNEQKYLVAGSYTLVEKTTVSGYSVWKNGVSFTIGTGSTTLGKLADTGEHGTAWISTSGIGSLVLMLKADYVAASTQPAGHAIGDTCSASTIGEPAYNLESRGVVSFTKVTDKGTTLDTHERAEGEDSAYFGIYTDPECTIQVAGMVPKAAGGSDEAVFVLTDQTQDGKTLNLSKGTGASAVPYLREVTDTTQKSTYPEYKYTLLSGKYYIKELSAPAGYQTDTTVRTLTIPELQLSSEEEQKILTNSYMENLGTISGLNNQQWPNTPEKLTVYKLDQFGQNAQLAENGYLELTVNGTGNTFPTGETTIRLYPDSTKAATKTDGTTVLNSYVTYGGTGTISGWTIQGLLVAGKSYTLSEPAASVHGDYNVAKSITFTMGTDSTITITGGAEAKDNPTQAGGEDTENYYESAAGGSTIVLRDTSKQLKNILIKKIDAKTGSTIADISFRLYKYDSLDAQGNPVNAKSVLPASTTGEDGYLTTDENGIIDLNKCTGIINQTSGLTLNYGLELGNYYLEEIEAGASADYLLLDKIYFKIEKKIGGSTLNYNDYAQLKEGEVTDGHVVITADTNTITVKNDHVTSNAKTLELTKIDSASAETKLSDARFTLTYTSINDPGTTWTKKYVTDTDGLLYAAGEDWTITTPAVKPDISAKGTYVLREVKAPDGYITKNDSAAESFAGTKVLAFAVNSNNRIEVTYTNTELVSSAEVVTAEGKLVLQAVVKNEKTAFRVAKRNDIKDGRKIGDPKNLSGELLSGAVLEIYEGTEVTETPVRTLDGDNSSWNVEGLKENTVYILHEKSAPEGYKVADDIIFKLSGEVSVSAAEGTESKVYVWTGGGTPEADNESGWSDSTNLADNVLTMVDEMNSVTFSKINVVDKEAGLTTARGLAGAVFEVHEDDGKGGYKVEKVAFYAAPADTEKVTSVTTGADGKVNAYGLPVDNEEGSDPVTYHLVEVKAPAGYKLKTDSIAFTMDRQGKVQIIEGDGGTTVSDTVTMQDEAIKLYIRKIGDSGEPLSGAKFRLTDTCSGDCEYAKGLADGSTAGEYTVTAQNGILLLPVGKVAVGHTYTLTETSAPSGYTGNVELSFHVAEDGTIDKFSSNGSAYLDDTKTTIIVKNEKIHYSDRDDEDDSNAENADVAKNIDDVNGTNRNVNVKSAKKTGDTQNPLFWLQLAAGAGLFMILFEVIERYLRKHKKDKK